MPLPLEDDLTAESRRCLLFMVFYPSVHYQPQLNSNAGLAGLYKLIDRLPGDDTDTWSCSRLFRKDLVSWAARLGPGLRVVEIGTYRGLTTLLLSCVFASVVTIDVNSTLLAAAAVR